MLAPLHSEYPNAAWRLKSLIERLLRSAVFYGAFATCIRLGANIFLLPLVLSKLSSEELALWWIFLALGAFANLAEFGFGPSISRVYSFLWAGAEDVETEGLSVVPNSGLPNLPRIRQLNATVRYLYWRLSLAAMVLLSAAGTLFLLKPAAAFAQSLPIWPAWGLYVIAIGFSLGSNHWMLACQGINRMRGVQKIFLWTGLSYLISATIFILAGFGIMALVIATGLRSLLARELFRRVYLRAVPAVDSLGLNPDPSILKRLWPNAYKFGILSIGVYLQANSNILICSYFLGAQTTAAFGLTAQIGTFLMNFAGLWLAVKWPEITILRTQGRADCMAVLFAKRLALTIGTFVALALLLIMSGNTLLEWKGAQTRLLSNRYLIVYLIYLLQQLFYVQFGSLAYTENVMPFFRVALLTGLGIVGLSVILTLFFGLWGLLLAPFLAETAYSTWFVVRRGFRGQPLTVQQFMRAALVGHL